MIFAAVPDDIADIELAQFVLRGAARYTPFPAVANRIARRAVWIATSRPDFLEEPDVKHALLSVLHVVALEELGIKPASTRA